MCHVYHVDDLPRRDADGRVYEWEKIPEPRVAGSVFTAICPKSYPCYCSETKTTVMRGGIRLMVYVPTDECIDMSTSKDIDRAPFAPCRSRKWRDFKRRRRSAESRYHYGGRPHKCHPIESKGYRVLHQRINTSSAD